MGVILKGMTWSHPRGHDPMVAASARFAGETGVQIVWDKRSLQDFESFPVEELAARYDLIVIDHPHVGQITAEHCLLPLDAPGDPQVAAIAAGSVGASYPSYGYEGRQWAFPIDAATQVQAYRPDRLPGPVTDFDAVVALAEAGRVLLPMRPPHALMCFFTLTAHLGHACSVTGPALVSAAAGVEAIEHLTRLTRPMPAAIDGMDPIAVFDRMAEPDSSIDLAPLIYGYVSYARAGFRKARLAFADMPVIGARPPHGSALGGTGIAVSARTAHPDAAIAFARFVASGPVQASLYVESGGQAGHADAWDDPRANAATLDFYRATRATLEGAFVRPRHDGYMAFQHRAATLLTEGLRARRTARAMVDDINRLFADSFAEKDRT